LGLTERPHSELILQDFSLIVLILAVSGVFSACLAGEHNPIRASHHDPNWFDALRVEQNWPGPLTTAKGANGQTGCSCLSRNNQ
jgi:hypothetical protein